MGEETTASARGAPRRGLARLGRPRSDRASRDILDAARELIVEEGFAQLRLEHVAARAGVGKATIYRRWRSKEALALDVLLELAAPNVAGQEHGDTRDELRTTVGNVIRALTQTAYGPVIRALLSEIAVNPSLGDSFRATVVEARRAEVGGAVARGIARGDLRTDVDAGIATEMLLGPVYYRLMFGGGDVDDALADQVVSAFLDGYGAR